jgi:hypothetical protein
VTTDDFDWDDDDAEAINAFELRVLATMSQENALWDELTEDHFVIQVNRKLFNALVVAQAEYGCTSPETVALYLHDLAGQSPLIAEAARRLLADTQAFPESLRDHYLQVAMRLPVIRAKLRDERKIREQAGLRREVDLQAELFSPRPSLVSNF